MRNIRKAGPEINVGLAIMFILIPAFLAVFKYAMTGLNADIILNQIMASQKVTLFYWGQNRLLNLIPFLLQPLSHWPFLSLFSTLFIATASFFGCLWMCALLAAKLEGAQCKFWHISLVYTLNVTVFCVFLKQDGWISLCLWHFEYTLALLLILFNIFAIYWLGRIWLIISFFAGFIALGLNPALILLLAPMAVCIAILGRRIMRKDMFSLLLWTAFFIFWTIISSLYGSFDNYGSLVFGAFGVGAEKFIVNLFSEYLYAGRILGAVFAGLLLLFVDKVSWQHAGSFEREKSLTLAAAICAIFYAGVVACIPWYHMNGCSPRYFSFLAFILIFVLSLWEWRYINRISPRTIRFAAALFLGCICIFLFPQRFNLYKTDIYNECYNMLPPGSRFYVGDYWKIWACASRDMNRGHTSHTLGYRSKANGKKIREALHARQAEDGSVEIFCLNAPLEECKRQLGEYYTGYELTRIEKLNENTMKLRLHGLTNPLEQ